MAGVNKALSAGHNRLPTADHRHLPIADRIETVKERIVQECLSSLYSATSDLTLYRDHGRRFVAVGVTAENAATHVAGLTDHTTFKNAVQSLHIQQVLRDSGLTSTEIDLMLRCDRSIPSDNDARIHVASSSKSYRPKDIETNSVLSSLEAVLAKLSRRVEILRTEGCQPESFHGALVLSRRELEEAVLQGRLEGGGEAFVRLQPRVQPAVHPDHPLNHLAHLEHQLFPPPAMTESVTSQASTKPLSLFNARREDLLETLQEDLRSEVGVQSTDITGISRDKCVNLTKPIEDIEVIDSAQGLKRKISPDGVEYSPKPGSMWDVREVPIRAQQRPTYPQKGTIAKFPIKIVVHPSPEFKISNKKLKKDYSQGFVSVPDPGELIPLSEIEANRVSTCELQQVFPRYFPGHVSSTLYIKNLSVQCTPHDLVKVFGHFDTLQVRSDSTQSQCDAGSSSLDHRPIKLKTSICCLDTGYDQSDVGAQQRVVYRLLQGRMRGQAFVRFPDREAATAALQACLGYKLRGKPMVIEYGKEKY